MLHLKQSFQFAMANTSLNTRLNAWLNNYLQSQYVIIIKLSISVPDQGISAIWTKTAVTTYAGTTDDVDIEICNENKKCSSTALDDPNKDDRKKGNLDAYLDYVLGYCFNESFFGDLSVTSNKIGQMGGF